MKNSLKKIILAKNIIANKVNICRVFPNDRIAEKYKRTLYMDSFFLNLKILNKNVNFEILLKRNTIIMAFQYRANYFKKNKSQKRGDFIKSIKEMVTLSQHNKTKIMLYAMPVKRKTLEYNLFIYADINNQINICKVKKIARKLIYFTKYISHLTYWN